MPPSPACPEPPDIPPAPASPPAPPPLFSQRGLHSFAAQGLEQEHCRSAWNWLLEAQAAGSAAGLLEQALHPAFWEQAANSAAQVSLVQVVQEMAPQSCGVRGHTSAH